MTDKSKAIENGRAPAAAVSEPPRERRPRSPWFLPGVLAIVVLVLGMAGYFVFIPATVINTSAMARLLPSKGALSSMGGAPAFNGSIPILPNSLSSVTKAAKDDPGHTGSYSIQWFGSGQSGTTEDLLLYLLPSASIARQVDTQQQSTQTSASALKAAKYDLTARFKDASVDAVGVAYLIPRTTQNSAGQTVPAGTSRGLTLVVIEGRAVARIVLQGPKVTSQEAIAIAKQEHQLLASRLPHFNTMASTHYAPLASLYYGIGLLVALAIALFTPGLVRRNQERQLQREAERARYQYRVRGAKTLKRHKARF